MSRREIDGVHPLLAEVEKWRQEGYARGMADRRAGLPSSAFPYDEADQNPDGGDEVRGEAWMAGWSDEDDVAWPPLPGPTPVEVGEAVAAGLVDPFAVPAVGGEGLAALVHHVNAAVDAGDHLTAEGDAAFGFVADLLQRTLVANREAAAAAVGGPAPVDPVPEQDPNDWVELSVVGYNFRQERAKLIAAPVHAGDFAAIARVEIAVGPLTCRRCGDTFPFERPQADTRLCQKCRRLVIVDPQGRPLSPPS